MPLTAFDENDKTILGVAAEVLQMSGLVFATSNPPGVSFDPKRPAQNWYIPDATEGLITLKFATNPATHGIDFDHPRLVQAAIPIEWLKTPNIQDNPNLQGGVSMLLPPPLHDLAPGTHLVTLGLGAYLAPQLYVRQGPDPVLVTPGTTEGGVFSQDDRTFILTALTTLLNR